jgi:predicted lactoylglutathione lyase
MSRKIFVNLPVKDLDKSKQFFAKLGFSFNPQFTNEEGACMVISDDIYAMLLTTARFRDFTPGEVADANRATEVLLCLSCESRGEVDELTNRAVAGGGRTFRPPQDHGFMYGRSFQDPDGHVWELVWMDPSAVKKE